MGGAVVAWTLRNRAITNTHVLAAVPRPSVGTLLDSPHTNPLWFPGATDGGRTHVAYRSPAQWAWRLT